MRHLVLFLLAGAALAQAPANQVPSNQAPAPQLPFLKSVGTMSEIMIDIVFPTSNEVFYVNREPNKTEKDWEDLRNNALVLAESANLLMAENRAKDKDRWMKDAQLLWEVGNKAFKAAKAKDLEGLKALNDDLYEACQSCHEHYRPGYRRRL
jgi:cytochrome c556